MKIYVIISVSLLKSDVKCFGQILQSMSELSDRLKHHYVGHMVVWFPNPLAAFLKSDGDPI